jgi:hypothetical protein
MDHYDRYLLKDVSSETLVSAILAATRGESFLQGTSPTSSPSSTSAIAPGPLSPPVNSASCRTR